VLLSADDPDFALFMREMGATSFCTHLGVCDAFLVGVKCLECDRPSEVWHHLIPKSRGGARTIPLCGECHAKAHHAGANMAHSTLTKQGLQRAKARGVKLGSARDGAWSGREHLRGFKKATERSAVKRRAETDRKYAHLVPKLKELRTEGHTLDEIAHWLNNNGHVTRDGKVYTKPAVWRLFQRHAPECLGSINRFHALEDVLAAM